MHRRIESKSPLQKSRLETSPLETRLATTLIADLIEREADDYDSLEIVHDVAQTGKFRRDVRPSKALRTMDDYCPTVPFVRHSEPYERIEIDIQAESKAFVRPELEEEPQTTAFARCLVANNDLVAVDVAIDVVDDAAKPAAIETPTAYRVVGALLLLGAFAVGVGLPFLAALVAR